MRTKPLFLKLSRLLVICFGMVFVSITLVLGSQGTASDFLNMLSGTRSAALGGSYSAMGQDAEVIYYNPAGILNLLNPQIGFSHLAWWDGITYDAVWGVQPLGNNNAIGIALNYLNVLPFNSTNDETIKESSAWYGMGMVSYAIKPLRSLNVGAQVKYIVSTLDTQQSMSAAMDCGGQYFLLNDQFIIAVTLKNLGFSTSLIDEADPLPMQATVGAAYQLWPDEANRLTVTTEWSLPFADTIQGAVGIEGWAWNTVALRCGVKTSADSGDWLTLGAGVRWRQLALDYALAPASDLGMTHRFSLAFDFGSQRRLARPKLHVTILTKQFLYSDGEPGQEIHLIPKSSIAAGLDRWQVSVLNKNQKVIRTMAGDKTMPLNVIWKGMDNDHIRTDVEGYYQYHFKIWDKLGYSAQTSGEILPISITKLPKLKALPRDIFAGKVSFTPQKKKKVKAWSITIVNDNGKILKKYQGKGMIPKDFAWDGTDKQNRKVALRKGYRFVLRITDQEDNEVKSIAPIVVVNAGTKAKTEEGLALSEQIPFYFDLSAQAAIKGWALDIMETDTGKVIRSVESEGTLPEKLFWDARDEQGNIVPSNKSYSYVLRLQDPIGNVWRQASTLRETKVKVIGKSEDGLTIKIEQILFDFNKAELKTEMHEKLRKTADLVREYTKEDIKLYIEGHTDNVGSARYNQELSHKRATMVMRYLVEEEKLSSSSIIMKGYGKSQPVLKDDTELARSMNRRVEITIVLPKK